MPLNAQEREWLERRKTLCPHCEFASDCIGTDETECVSFRPKEMWEDYLSAATFEARVAAKLAEYCADFWQRESAWHALKDARIAVEQEMDNADQS